MAKKEFMFRGKKIEELQALSVKEVAKLLCSSARRKITRGFTEAEQTLLANLEHAKGKVKTHCRDMVILPSMVGKTISIYTGKEFADVIIQPQMIGHRLGEFALTRKHVKHGDAGVGATKGKGAVSTRG